MKKNLSFLFALFLMFTGAMNVYAGAYPFKLTTDAENPELYAIQSGRGSAYWWTLDESDGSLVLKAYESAPTQYWYFMEVTEGDKTYLQLFPYAGEGKAMSYSDPTDGHSKVFAQELGAEGYDSRWIFDANGGNAPFGLKTSNDATWLSNYGGSGYKYGFYGRGPAADGGSAMYLSYVKLEPIYSKTQAVINSDMYQLHQKYGLIKDTKKFYCNVPQTNEGSLDHLLDNKYDTYFHSAWSASMGKPESHYLQAEVSAPVKEFSFYFKKRHNNNNNRPVDMTIQGSADGVTYKNIANITSGFPISESELAYLSDVITAPEACKFFRFVINKTNNNALTSGYPFFTYSEFYILPNNDEVAEKVALHKAARNVLAVSETEDESSTMYDTYLTLTDMLEKGAGVFANDLVATYNALAADYFAGKNLSKALTEFNTLMKLTASNDLFTPVTNEASLAANKRYVLAAAESAVAMAAQHEGATPYRLTAKVEKVRDFIESKVAVAEDEELPYMIELVAAEGGWLLKDVVYGQYLVWEEKRSLDLTSNMSKASVFEISINDNGEAKIKLAGENRTIRYGAEDGRFACYTTGQEAIKLYEDAIANDFALAYIKLGNLFNTCGSLFMIPAVSEKAMIVAEAAEAINAAGVVTCDNNDLNAAVTAINELDAYAWAMDAKYNEFKDALWACYDLQDNSKASVKVATAFAAVVDKYSAYQWSVPATTVADFEAYIAELNDAARAYAIKAAPADGFTFDNIAVESEWNGAALGKSLAGHLYNPAADAFLGTGNHWGSQASFVENGHQWTVSSENLYDFAWLFDGAEDVCAANVGDINLVPCKVGDKNTAPVAFAEDEDNGIEQTAEGIYLPKTTALFLDLNEEADLTNYTLVYDMKAADFAPYISLIQTNLNNNDDGDLFIKANGQIGLSSNGGLGYSGQLEADQWYKIAIVVNEGIISLYIDGVFAKASENSEDNRWAINKEGVYLFLDNDGEHNDVELAGIKLWKKALTEAEVAQLNEAASAPTYTVSGPLAHPQDPAAYRYLAYRPGNNAGYADQLAQEHTFTLVGKNLYTIQSYEGKYLAYQEGNVVVRYVNQMDENCYWQFVTDEEFRSKFASASYDAPANATFAVPSANFCYNDTETKEWTGSASFGGEDANFNAYKENTEAWEMATELHNMPNGVYRMKVQGFYRQGTSATEADRAAVAATRDNGTEIAPAKFFANDATVTVMNILDDAGKNTTSTHGVIYGSYGKAPHSANDASVYFNLGLYEHTLVFEVKEGDNNTIKMGLVKDGGVANDWVVMDNIRLEYLGAKNNVDFMGNGILTAMTEGEKYVYYTDANGGHHFLYAAGANNWVLVDEPTTIKFSNGNTSAGTFAPLASHMESNGLYMSNQERSDGTGPIATHAPSNRDCESQVFYKNVENKYAIRITNSTAETWGCFKFANVDPETLSVFASEPSLSDALYIWNITEEAPEVSAIEEVEAAEVANRAYYTLGGVLIDEPVLGVNIVKTTYTNGKVEIQKILVK